MSLTNTSSHLQKRIFSSQSSNISFLEKQNINKNLMMTFFTKPNKTILCSYLYKNLMILGMNDSSISIFDYQFDKLKTEISDLSVGNYKLIDISVLYSSFPYRNTFNDAIICLCENRIFIFDANSYMFVYSYSLTLKSTPVYIKILYDFDEYNPTQASSQVNQSIFLHVISKKGVQLLTIPSHPNGIIIKYAFEVDCEVNLNTNNHEVYNGKNSFLINKSFFIVDTKKKLLIYKYKQQDDMTYSIKMISLSKRESLIYKYPDNKYMSTDPYNIFTLIDYSYYTNKVYLSVLNKVIVLKNTFSEYLGEEVEIIQKTSKSTSIINYLSVSMFYLISVVENKAYVSHISNIEKTIEVVDLNGFVGVGNIQSQSSDELGLFNLLNRVYYQTSTKTYMDELYMFKLNNNQDIKDYDYDFSHINSHLRTVIYTIDMVNNKIKWKYSPCLSTEIDYETQTELSNVSFSMGSIMKDLNLKMYSQIDYENLLHKDSSCIVINEILYQACWFSKQKSDCNEGNLFFYDVGKYVSDEVSFDFKHYNTVVSFNFLYFRMKSISFLFFLINKSMFIQAAMFIEQSRLDIIYVIFLVYDYLYSEDVKRLLKIYLSHIGMSHLFTFQQTRLDSENENHFIQNEKKLSLFIKAFLNKAVISRNYLKKLISKETRKEITYKKIIEESNKCNNQLEFEDLIKLKWVVLENFIFLMYIYCVKLIKSSKYKENLNLLIKQSVLLIDNSYVDILYSIRLREEVVYMLFYIGDYSKCLLRIIEFFEEEERIEKESSFLLITNANQSSNEKMTIRKTSFVKSNVIEHEAKRKFLMEVRNSMKENEDNEEKNRIEENFNKLNDWFFIYLNVIIYIKDYISKKDFIEFLKWPLEKNTYITITIIYIKGILNPQSIDDNDYISILKSIGIESLINYFQVFLYDSRSTSSSRSMMKSVEEIQKLYLTKIKILYEEVRSIDSSLSLKNEDANCEVVLLDSQSQPESQSQFIVNENKDNIDYMNDNDNNNNKNKPNIYTSILKGSHNQESKEDHNQVKSIKSNIQKTRESLISLIIKYEFNIESFLFQLEIINSNTKLDFLTEKGICLSKKGQYEEGVYMIIKEKLSMYYNILLDLIKHNSSYDLISIILLKIKETNENFDFFIKQVLYILNNTSQYEVLLLLMNNNMYIKALSSEETLSFFFDLFTKMEREGNDFKIKNSLSENRLLYIYEDLYSYNQSCFVVSEFDYCRICQSGFFQSEIIYYKDVVYHKECYLNKLDYERNEKRKISKEEDLCIK